MKKFFPFVMLFGILLSCKKEKTKQQPENSPANQELPASNYKRVSLLKKYDTVGSFKAVYTHQFQYSYNSGRLYKEIITDSLKNNNTVSTTTKTYSYSAGIIDSYTVTFSYDADKLEFHKYIYDSGKILTEMGITHSKSNAFPNDTSYLNYTHYLGGYTDVLINYSPPTYGSKQTYLNGDLYRTYYLWNGSWYLPNEYNYSTTLTDKSRQFFNETAFLPADCKLLENIYIPAGPGNPSGPTTITYTYEFDQDGYPVKYENTSGIKWRVYYY